MSEFDPPQRAIVHDVITDKTFPWRPELFLENYKRFAEADGAGMVAWDGMLLDGWTKHITSR